uniref:uncharacterized protein LOC124071027 isoform X2 n=1 Tax=Scatophagus argus TaxID=75038 RepID=UPI001ED7F3CF|nr:uncharacterized protein LOC124071027 isoform X2 [Scatophagus argus]
MIIRCSSEGDEVEFTLTLDGLLLTETRNHSQSQTNWTANMKPLAGSEAEHKASSSNVTISLHGQVTGSLKCHVGNKVSRDETVVHLTSCEGSVSKPAPVSKPAVSQTCLSPEQMIISCSSEGDEVEFTLTLDGLLLVQTRNHSQSQTNWTANMKPLAGSEAEHKASSSNVTISLHGQVTGSLKCHVGNKVSRDETVVHLTSCEGSISHLSLLAVAVIVSVVTLLLHAALFLCIKHLNKKTRPTTVTEALSDNPEDEKGVRVKKKTRPTQLDPHLTVCYYHVIFDY